MYVASLETDTYSYNTLVENRQILPIGTIWTILLIGSWTDQAAINIHHISLMLKTIAALRDRIRGQKIGTIDICKIFLWLERNDEKEQRKGIIRTGVDRTI